MPLLTVSRLGDREVKTLMQSTSGGITANGPSKEPLLNSHETSLTEESLVSARLDFAQRIHANAQNLVRLIDDKSNYLLAVVGLLTAALGALLTQALPLLAVGHAPGANSLALDWALVVRALSIVVVGVYLIITVIVLYDTSQVYMARPHRLRPDSSSPGLLFPLIILQLYSNSSNRGQADEDLYYQRLSTLTPDEILHDYSNQIIEISNIYKIKQSHLNLSTRRFRYLVFNWAAAMLLLLLTIILYGSP